MSSASCRRARQMRTSPICCPSTSPKPPLPDPMRPSDSGTRQTGRVNAHGNERLRLIRFGDRIPPGAASETDRSQVMKNKPLASMTDEELENEHLLWEDEIASADRWGASLT